MRYYDVTVSFLMDGEEADRVFRRDYREIDKAFHGAAVRMAGDSVSKGDEGAARRILEYLMDDGKAEDGDGKQNPRTVG